MITRAATAVLFLFANACTCDQRFVFTSSPCHYDINGCEENTPCYNQDKAQWKAQLDAGTITYSEYRRRLGYG